MKQLTILLLATTLLSCSSAKITQDRVEFEYEVIIQSERAEKDVYKIALENCYNK